MKKFARFLLVVIVGLGFLGLTYARDLDESTYSYLIVGGQTCQGDSLGAALAHGLLILILLMIILLSIGAIPLGKKLRKTSKGTGLFFVPLLNLYPLCKITIGKMRFYGLVLFSGFFVYLEHKNSDGCASTYINKLILPIFIVGILSIGILLVLTVKLINYPRNPDKESHSE